MKNSTLTFLITLVAFSLCAQDYKFGKVSKEELKEKFYSKDSTTSAAVLYRETTVDYQYVEADGFKVVKSVYERIKIYDKEGFDHASVRERLYTGGKKDESFTSLKALTYNLEGDEIQKSKLKNSEVFTNELSKYYDEVKFTMPNLKVGSVVEYQYKVISPYTYSIDEIVLQYDIPIKEQEISVAIPEYYTFTPRIKGYLNVAPKNSTSNDKINYSYRTKTVNDFGLSNGSRRVNTINYKKMKSKFSMKDVPALKEEAYVNNMDNYRSSVNYEIQFVKFPNEIGKSYATSWESVAKTIYESDNFGKQLQSSRYFKNDLSQLLNGETNPVNQAFLIFKFVQDRMNWNEYVGKFTDEGVKEAYNKKSGSVADINLMLVAMLKSAGLNANPVLVSTRDNGVPLFPSRDGFNYVVASVDLKGQTVLMDACNKYTEPGLLPTKALNWFGRLVMENGTSSSISMMPNRLSKKITFLNVDLAANGDLSGKERVSHDFYNAYLFRNRINSISEDDYLEKKENSYGEMEISNYQVKNKNILGKPIVESYDFTIEAQSDVIGDKIYFSPLFFHTEKENPFKLEERNYPVDFIFPKQDRITAVINIPEGYKIASVPEPLSLVLPKEMGSFKYKTLQKENQLQVVVDIVISEAIVPSVDYQPIKDFFKMIVEKETEKVVLSKI